MDPSLVKNVSRELETTNIQPKENSAKKKKKKKKKKKTSKSDEASSNQDVSPVSDDAENSKFSVTSQESIVKEPNIDCHATNIVEKEPGLSVPFSETTALCESEDKRKSQAQPSCDYDASLNNTTHSTSENKAKKKKKKKKRKSGGGVTNEEKEDKIFDDDSDIVEFSNNVKPKPESGDNSLKQHDNNFEYTSSSGAPSPCIGKTGSSEEDEEDKKRSEATAKKKEKEQNGASEKKEFVLGKSGECNTKNAVACEKNTTSSSPVSSRKKKKKKKGGGILLSQLSLTEPRSDSDKEKDGTVAIEKELRDDKEEVAGDSYLKRLTEERSLLELQTRERNNLFTILTIICGLGLDTLRDLFMKIHPKWSNKPVDAKNLDKGKMELQDHELACFNTGNINDWDVSLITTVLLYSPICAKKVRNLGYEDAVRTIKEQKNLVISHITSERMTDGEFSIAWGKITKSLETIGASPEDIEDIRTSDSLETGKFYRDMLLEELAKKDTLVQDLKKEIEKIPDAAAEKVFSRLSCQPGTKREELAKNATLIQDLKKEIEKIPDAVAEKVASRLSCQPGTKCEDQPHARQLDGRKFDEWIRFYNFVREFNHHENNYVLITDAMSAENLRDFSVLGSVPWKIVLDFDPSSEENGMYQDFKTNEGKNILIDMTTPDEIRSQHASTINLAKHIDSRKTQWLFVRGREKDNSAIGGVQIFEDWKSSSVKDISRFLICCADPEKMDKHKPLICLFLPFLAETLPFLEVTVQRLIENFGDFNINLVSTTHDNVDRLKSSFPDIRLTNLSPGDLSGALQNVLQVFPGKEYRMPTYLAKVPAKLTHDQYLYFQEYLVILNDGCEDHVQVDNCEDEKQLNKVLNEHRESFLSGNRISFVSLYDNHDARREVGEDVRNHIQRLLEQRPTHSTILEIRHSPGTGGTTIARRVLWDLHKSYPCAIVRLEDYRHDFDDDLHFINSLSERISALSEKCKTCPVILLDGNHSWIEALSNKLVRVLNSSGQRAVLLRCLHRTVKANDKESNPEADVNHRFNVQVTLEDSLTDLNQFKEKYKDYIDNFQNKTASSPCRVFHFPLLAMLKGLEGFDTKLKQIVNDSFDGMGSIQKEIAVTVAFIQKYASQETPAFLLYKTFKKYVSNDDNEKGITDKEVSLLITDQLLSLMVPAKPTKHRGRTSTRRLNVRGTFTLQHPLVTDMILERHYSSRKSNIFALTREFLQFPVLQDDQFFSLVNDLFILNRTSHPKSRFSVLFEELKSLNPREASKLFCELAEKTSDAVVFVNAARFHAMMSPPDFEKAEDLIDQAFECKNAPSKSRKINVTKGQILLTQLRFKIEGDTINSVKELEDLADKALQSYNKSRNWPITNPHPLMGEVKVWIACIEWITKNECNGDTDKAFDYITSKAPPVFHACICESFRLLDLVESIVQRDANLAESEQIQKQANSLRMSLSRTFNKDKGRALGRR